MKTYNKVKQEIIHSPNIVFSKRDVCGNKWLPWALNEQTLTRIYERGELPVIIIPCGSCSRWQIKKEDLLDYITKNKRMF